MLFARHPTLLGCALAFVSGNCLAHDGMHHRACIMLVFDGHFGILHEGLQCVHHAERHLLLHRDTLTACCLPGCVICVCICILVEHWSLIRVLGSRSCVMVMTGILSGVLLGVTGWWRRFVPFNACLAVGFCVCIMVGKSMMQGSVIFGVLLITLFSSACTYSHVASVTLCSSRMGVGFNKGSTFLPRYILSTASLW
jgi:hypothetical protein